jgi:ubiquinone/menaquinone biosynthesis C-methylase UbiE
MDNKNHFSEHAGDYARARPNYPQALFEYLASLCAAQTRAWDCGTGNGQAALGLAPLFAEIIASDASDAQLAEAPRHPRIEYLQCPAERTPFASRSFDLVTVAQALHWFDMEAFFNEARRVLKKDGVLAAWSYELSRISSPVDAVILHYYTDILGADWPPEREHVVDSYRNIRFPFREIAAPTFRPVFQMEQRWSMHEYLDYLYSWSATQRYLKRTGHNPLELIRAELTAAWGEATAARTVIWPLNMRVGTVE